MSRTQWYVVNAQIELRNRERVQYAQDEIKVETRKGTTVHTFVFLLEVDDHPSDEHLKGVANIYMKEIFRFSPVLEEGKINTFEVKDIKFTKADGVFRAFSARN